MVSRGYSSKGTRLGYFGEHLRMFLEAQAHGPGGLSHTDKARDARGEELPCLVEAAHQRRCTIGPSTNGRPFWCASTAMAS